MHTLALIIDSLNPFYKYILYNCKKYYKITQDFRCSVWFLLKHQTGC